PTAQHQEKIDYKGLGARTACFQFDLIELQFLQLKLQLGQIRSLTGQKLGISQPQQLFLFGVQIQIFIDVLHNRGFQTGDLVDFVQKVVQLSINRRQEDQLSTSVVQIGNNGRKSSVAR